MSKRKCLTCPNLISLSGVTGKCKACLCRERLKDPIFAAKFRQGGVDRYKNNPVFAAKQRKHCREMGRRNGTDPLLNARLVERGRLENVKRLQLPENIEKAHSPEARRKRGQKRTERCIGWCPPEWRDEYRYMTKMKRVPTGEARAIILAQVKADRDRVRAKLSPFERQMLDLEAKVKAGTQDIGVHDGVADVAFHLKSVGRAA